MEVLVFHRIIVNCANLVIGLYQQSSNSVVARIVYLATRFPLIWKVWELIWFWKNDVYCPSCVIIFNFCRKKMLR